MCSKALEKMIPLRVRARYPSRVPLLDGATTNYDATDEVGVEVLFLLCN
jgi:hypothetical protein